MTKAILIDDEEDALKVTRELLRMYCPTVAVVGEARNVTEGQEVIAEHKPEVVFLDISMPGGTGFDLLKRYPVRSFEVIFITAYSQHVVQALRCSAVDYLLKPIDPDELMAAVERLQRRSPSAEAEQRYQVLQDNLHASRVQRLTLSTSDGVHFIQLPQLIRIEADRNYSHLYLDGGEVITVAKTLGHFEKMLPKEDFFRASQSQLVQLSYVRKLLPNHRMLLLDGTEIKMGKGLKQTLLARM